jgi:hypothetical protein
MDGPGKTLGRVIRDLDKCLIEEEEAARRGTFLEKRENIVPRPEMSCRIIGIAEKRDLCTCAITGNCSGKTGRVLVFSKRGRWDPDPVTGQEHTMAECP